MLDEFKKLIDETDGRLSPNTDKAHASFVRRILCRFIDVAENYPSFYRNLSLAENMLSKFCEIDGEGFHNCSIRYKEVNGEKKCVFSGPSYDSYGDCDGNYTIMSVHEEVLTDYWKEYLDMLHRKTKIEAIKKQIAEIENIISNGPSQIVTLKKELEKWEKSE